MFRTWILGKPLAIATVVIAIGATGTVLAVGKAGPSPLAASAQNQVIPSQDFSQLTAQHPSVQVTPPAALAKATLEQTPIKTVARASGPVSLCRVSDQVGKHCDYPIYTYVGGYTYPDGTTWIWGSVWDSDPHPKAAELGDKVFFLPENVKYDHSVVVTLEKDSPQYFRFTLHYKVPGPAENAWIISNAWDSDGAFSQYAIQIQVGTPRVSS